MVGLEFVYRFGCLGHHVVVEQLTREQTESMRSRSDQSFIAQGVHTHRPGEVIVKNQRAELHDGEDGGLGSDIVDGVHQPGPLSHFELFNDVLEKLVENKR